MAKSNLQHATKTYTLAKYSKDAHPLIKFLRKQEISLHQVATVLDISYPYLRKILAAPSRYLHMKDLILISWLTKTKLKYIIGLCIGEQESYAGHWFEDETNQAANALAADGISKQDSIPTEEEINRIKER